MTNLALLVLVLGGPVACPPEVGQIRWDGFEHHFKSRGKRIEVGGTLWDRDRDGKPSSGDLYRIERASGFAVDEAWLVIRGGLARALNRRFRKVKSSLRATCESRFEVQDVPEMSSHGALARYLREIGGDGPGPSRADRARADMAGWAEEACASKKHLEKGALEKLLYQRAARRHGRVGRRNLRRIAHEVAGQYGVKCGHLTIPGRLTFD